MTQVDPVQVSWVKKLVSNITIEPVVIFFIFGVVISTGLRIFELEKVCMCRSLR